MTIYKYCDHHGVVPLDHKCWDGGDGRRRVGTDNQRRAELSRRHGLKSAHWRELDDKRSSATAASAHSGTPAARAAPIPSTSTLASEATTCSPPSATAAPLADAATAKKTRHVHNSDNILAADSLGEARFLTRQRVSPRADFREKN
jgi:hypothetical protein